MVDGDVAVIVVLYVDNIIVNKDARVEAIKRDLHHSLDITDMGLLHYFLDIECHKTSINDAS